jgi:hypothetical protein
MITSKPCGFKKNILFLVCQLLIPIHTVFATQKDNTNIEEPKPDSLSNPHAVYQYIRGIEQEKKDGFNPLLFFARTLSFIPNQIIKGVQYTTGYGAHIINNKKFIENIEDFFFTDNRTLGWYPLIDATSSYRPRLGANVLYKHKNNEGLIKANYADRKKFMVETIFSHRIKQDEYIWKITLSALEEHDDDRKFYGIGNNPGIHPKSCFLPDPLQDYGLYYQRRQKIESIFGFRPHPYWQFFLTHFYQKRKIGNVNNPEESISHSFDLKRLIGHEKSVEVSYSELAIRLDNRDKNRYLSPGFRFEVYTGLSYASSENARYVRNGLDILVNIPMLKRNRIITPRLVINRVENLSDSVPLSFTEYPQHPSFRGVSDKVILRADNFVYIPSIEYQWPLSFNLGGHLFFDLLMVSETLQEISLTSTPWAVGVGVDFHGIDSELGRVLLAYGSEGIRASLTVGIDPFLNNRSNWK